MWEGGAPAAGPGCRPVPAYANPRRPPTPSYSRSGRMSSTMVGPSSSFRAVSTSTTAGPAAEAAHVHAARRRPDSEWRSRGSRHRGIAAVRNGSTNLQHSRGTQRSACVLWVSRLHLGTHPVQSQGLCRRRHLLHDAAGLGAAAAGSSHARVVCADDISAAISAMRDALRLWRARAWR